MRPLLCFLGLLTVGVYFLSYLTAGHCRVSIQDSLTTAAQSKLAAAGLGEVQARFDHLDAVLEGNVSDPQQADQASKLIGEMEGVRMLKNNNRIEVAASASRLSINRKSDDLIEVFGRVPSQERADAILEQIRSGQPGIKLDNQLKVDSRAKVPWWNAADESNISNFLANTAGDAELTFNATHLLARGDVANGGQARELTDQFAKLARSGISFENKIAVAPSTGSPAELAIVRSNNQIDLTGRVPYPASKEAIISSIRRSAPTMSLQDRLVVDPKTASATWLTDGPEVVHTFMSTVSEGQFQLGEKSATLSGNVRDEASLQALGKAAQSLIGVSGKVNNQLEIQPITVEKAMPAPTPAPAEKQLTTVFRKNAVYFASGSKALSSEDQDKLKTVAAAVKQQPSIKLYVGGYADSTGNAAANRTLSLQRANAVKSALLSLGVSDSQLVVESFGAEKVSSEEAWKSRRVELSIHR